MAYNIISKQNKKVDFIDKEIITRKLFNLLPFF